MGLMVMTPKRHLRRSVFASLRHGTAHHGRHSTGRYFYIHTDPYLCECSAASAAGLCPTGDCHGRPRHCRCDSEPRLPHTRCLADRPSSPHSLIYTSPSSACQADADPEPAASRPAATPRRRIARRSATQRALSAAPINGGSASASPWEAVRWLPWRCRCAERARRPAAAR